MRPRYSITATVRVVITHRTGDKPGVATMKGRERNGAGMVGNFHVLVEWSRND